MKKRLSRIQYEQILQTMENYNCGFLTKKEYNCQVFGIVHAFDDNENLWHLVCLLPNWLHNLIFGIRLYFEK